MAALCHQYYVNRNARALLAYHPDNHLAHLLGILRAGHQGRLRPGNLLGLLYQERRPVWPWLWIPSGVRVHATAPPIHFCSSMMLRRRRRRGALQTYSHPRTHSAHSELRFSSQFFYWIERVLRFFCILCCLTSVVRVREMFVIYRASYDVYYCENVYLLTRRCPPPLRPVAAIVFIVLYCTLYINKYVYVGTLPFCTVWARPRRKARSATHIIPHIRGLRTRSTQNFGGSLWITS